MRTAVVLPGPVRPEHAEDGACRHLEVDPGQGDRRAVALLQALGLDHRLCRHRLRPVLRLGSTNLPDGKWLLTGCQVE